MALFLLAIKLLGEGQDVASCERLFRIELAHLPSILAHEDPFLLADMLNLLAHLHARPHLHRLEAEFIRCLKTTSIRIPGADYRLTRFWDAVAASEHATRGEFLCCSLKLVADQFQHILCLRDAEGPAMAVIKLHMSNICSFMYPERETSAQYLRELAAKAQKVPATDRTGLFLRMCAARRFLLTDGIKEAAEIMEDLVQQETCHKFM